jgi:hypothetical protein
MLNDVETRSLEATDRRRWKHLRSDHEPDREIAGGVNPQQVVGAVAVEVALPDDRRASGPDLSQEYMGTLEFLANTICRSLPLIGIAALRAGHTHGPARMYARSSDCLSGVVHLLHWP